MKKLWNSIKTVWENLPKPLKVAGYMLISSLLALALQDVVKLPEWSQKYVITLINFLIVFVEYAETEVRQRLAK